MDSDAPAVGHHKELLERARKHFEQHQRIQAGECPTCLTLLGEIARSDLVNALTPDVQECDSCGEERPVAWWYENGDTPVCAKCLEEDLLTGQQARADLASVQAEADRKVAARIAQISVDNPAVQALTERVELLDGEIERLSGYIVEWHPDEITEGSAVDNAIHIMQKSRSALHPESEVATLTERLEAVEAERDAAGRFSDTLFAEKEAAEDRATIAEDCIGQVREWSEHDPNEAAADGTPYPREYLAGYCMARDWVRSLIGAEPLDERAERAERFAAATSREEALREALETIAKGRPDHIAPGEWGLWCTVWARDELAAAALATTPEPPPAPEPFIPATEDHPAIYKQGSKLVGPPPSSGRPARHPLTRQIGAPPSSREDDAR